MASARERRAALQQREGTSALTTEPAEHVFAPTPPAVHFVDGEPIGPDDYIFRATEVPMKIRFDSVTFDEAIARLPGGNTGMAASSTQFFNDKIAKGTIIELDTATQLVRLSNAKGDELFVPLVKVKFFGPVWREPVAAADTAA